MQHLKSYLKRHHKTHLIFDFDETLFKLILPWENYLPQYQKAPLIKAGMNGSLSGAFGTGFRTIKQRSPGLQAGESSQGLYGLIEKLDSKLLKKYETGKLSLSKLQNELVKKYQSQVLPIILEHNMNFETKNLKGIKINQSLVDFILGSQNFTNFIWSSNTKQVIEPILDKQQIKHKFSKIVSRIEVVFIKPHHEGFQKIYDGKAKLSQYLLIGNSLADKEAALGAGIDFFHIDYFTPLQVD